MNNSNALSKKVKADTIEENTLRISMIGAFLLAIWGISMAYFSQSDAVLLDGAFNLISAVITFFSIKVTSMISRKESFKHPFGFFAYETLIVFTKGASILILIAISVTANVKKILSGGGEPKLGIMTIYVVIAVFACLAIYLIFRKSYKQIETELLFAEKQSWLLNTIISGSIGVAFLIAIFLQGTSLGWINRYLDQILVIIFSLIFIREPFNLVKDGLREFLLGSPKKEISQPFIDKLNLLKNNKEIKEFQVFLLKTGRRIWINVIIEPTKNSIKMEELLELKNELSVAMQEVYPNTFTQVTIDKIK